MGRFREETEMTHSIYLSAAAAEELETMPEGDRQGIRSTIQLLADQPEQVGSQVELISGSPDQMRLVRSKQWRILFRLHYPTGPDESNQGPIIIVTTIYRKSESA
jgi:mRNA-degrading endonuclease RelE of RelBE toxin-antitoxin system